MPFFASTAEAEAVGAKVVAALRPLIASYSTLELVAGHVTLGFDLTLDPKESWQSGIFENSRFSKFVINPEGKMKQLSHHYDVTKFRQVTLKSVDDIVPKLKKWIADNQKSKSEAIGFAALASEARSLLEV